MGIRPGEDRDVVRIVEMGERFIRSTPYAAMIGINPAKMAETVRMLMEHGVVFVYEGTYGAIDGMIGLMIHEHPVSGERVASELFWWVEPEARGVGILLLRRAERWARDNGAVAIQMVAPTPDVEHIYDRTGYSRTEVTYQKALNRSKE